MITTKDVLTQVLGITNYQGDKDEIIKKFLELTNVNAFNDLVSIRPKELQGEITQALQNVKTHEDITKVLGNYFDEKLIAASYEKAAKDLFTKIIEDLIPTLSEAQENKLQEYLQSLQK